MCVGDTGLMCVGDTGPMRRVGTHSLSGEQVAEVRARSVAILRRMIQNGGR